MTKIQLPSTTFTNSFYFKKGNGPVVFLLHGFAEDHTIWNYQVEQLAKSYCCILPDLPGTGASSDASSELSIADMADFIHEIAQFEQCSSFVLAGHSMGGYIALAYAEKYGSFLSGLGLIHSTAYADDDTKKENRLKSIRLIEGNENGKEVFLRAMVPNLYAEASHVKVASEMNRHLTIALNLSSITLINYYKAMIARTDKTHVLESFRKPVLFMIGKQDNAVPYKDVLSQSAIASQSMVHLKNDLGHTSMLEAPEILNSILNSFCEYVYEGKLP